jgi:hypothetical protein
MVPTIRKLCSTDTHCPSVFFEYCVLFFFLEVDYISFQSARCSEISFMSFLFYSLSGTKLTLQASLIDMISLYPSLLSHRYEFNVTITTDMEMIMRLQLYYDVREIWSRSINMSTIFPNQNKWTDAYCF